MKRLPVRIIPILVAVFLLSAPMVTRADEYDDSQSHPLRVVAYMLHPAGVLLEWTIFRPLHFLVSASPETEYVFGHKPHPPLFAEPQPSYDFGVPKKVAVQEPKAPPKLAVHEPVAEKVKVVEVPVEKIVYKEVPKIVEKVVEVEKEKVVFPDVAFRFDSADLTDLGRGKVYLAAQKLKQNADIVVVVEGHADHVGTQEYNQRLGLRRAQTVMNELTKLGIDPGRMSAATLGESRPLVDQPAEWARAVNRRVEFQVSGR